MVCACKICNSHCMCSSYAAFFEALGHPTRVHIINALREGEKTVSEIAEATMIEQSLLSHNLRKLQQRGLVNSERNGKNITYSLNGKTVETIMDLIDDHVRKHCGEVSL